MGFPLHSRHQRASRKLYLIIVVLVAVGCLQFYVNRVQTDFLSAVHAYAGTEGPWSKAQNDGIQNLFRYADSGEIADYRDFQQQMQVHVGARRARLELQMASPNLGIARSGFIAGNNHATDAEKMVWLFRHFRDLPHFARAIDIWTEGDREMAEIRRLARQLHEKITQGASSAVLDPILVELENRNRRLTLLEDRFSTALGEAARWVTRVSTAVNLGLTVLLLGVAGLLSWRLIRRAARDEAALAFSEAKFRRLAEADIIGVAFWHEDGTIEDANDAFLHMLGYSRGDLDNGNVNWRQFTPATHQVQADQAIQTMAEMGKVEPFETEWIHRDGHRIPVRLGAALLADKSDCGVAYAEDLTRQKRAAEEWRLAARVLEQAGQAIMITDARNRIIHVNRAFTEIAGYGFEEVAGKSPAILKSGRHGPDFYRQMWQQLETEGRWSGEIWDRHKSGEIYPKWLTITTVTNDHGEISHYAALFSDITEQKAEQETIRYLAEHDALTGLPSRMLFLDRLNQTIAHIERYGGQVALMFLDLDNFKAINDTHGHHAGDQFLKTVATRLSQCLRKSDNVCRLGGDEFVIMVRELGDPNDIEELAGRMLQSVSREVILQGQPVQVSPSIGIALCPRDGRDSTTLLEHADDAMYRAKHAGRNAYRFFTTDGR